MLDSSVFLMLASLAFPSSTHPTNNLRQNSREPPGIFAIPFDFTLGADAKYVATFAVGSQKTQMPIVMDLGSTDAWLYGPNDFAWGNTYIAGPFDCHLEVTPFYSLNSSTTVTHIDDVSWRVGYGGGFKAITGFIRVVDTLSVDASCKEPRLPFLVANTTIERLFDTTCEHPVRDYNGIFGLAGAVNVPPDGGELFNSSFRYNLQHPPAPQAPFIDSATMSIFLRNATTTSALQPMSGEIILGGMDTSAFIGPLISIANASHDPDVGYTVPVPNLSIAGVEVTLDPDLAQPNGDCLLDSGATGDTWPINLYTADYEYLPDAFFAQSGLDIIADANGILYTVYPSPCAEIPANATFDFTWPSPSGTNITVQVPIRNYARSSQEVNNQTCALQLDQVGCILGPGFLSGAYLLVDDDAGVVALAQAGEGIGGRIAIGSGKAIPGLVV